MNTMQPYSLEAPKFWLMSLHQNVNSHKMDWHRRLNILDQTFPSFESSEEKTT